MFSTIFCWSAALNKMVISVLNFMRAALIFTIFSSHDICTFFYIWYLYIFAKNAHSWCGEKETDMRQDSGSAKTEILSISKYLYFSAKKYFQSWIGTASTLDNKQKSKHLKPLNNEQKSENLKHLNNELKSKHL